MKSFSHLRSAQWLKIRKTAYTQWAGREKLFEREGDVDPDLYLWDACLPDDQPTY